MSDSFVNNKESLEERVNLFNQMALPGQPLGMHMGTSYLVNDLMREIQELREALKPFAQAAEDHMEQHQIAAEVGGYVPIDDNAEICVPITFGECSRARTKLEGSGA